LGLILITCVLSAGTQADGQAPDYGIDDVEVPEATEATDGAATGGMVDMAPALMPGGSSLIGAARSGVRNSGDQSAMLRYDQHREITPPEYATLRIGPLYSNLGISQSIGTRYTRLSGAGVDYLEGNRRGDIKDDGAEFPMVSGLTLNNYMIITRKMDLEANISINYFHYPMKTQEDDLQIDLTDEGIFATFSTQLLASKNSRILIYDDILYRTAYIDTRGLEDRYGGREYESLRNTAGLDWDWKPTPLDSFSAAASRRDTIPFDDEFDRQKGHTYAEMLSYRRSLSPFIAVGLLGNASQSFYDEAERPDVFLYGISAFTGLRLSRNLTGDASLGYQISTTSSDAGTDDESSSMSASLGLSHEIAQTRSQRLSYQRSLTEAFDGGVDIADAIGYQYTWSSGLFPGSLSSSWSRFDPQDAGRNGYADWTTSLGMQHQLTRLLLLSLGATYAMRMNDGTTDAGAGEPALADISSDYETLTLSASTGFRVTRKTQLTLYASHADRTSDNDDLVYTRDIVGATLTWAHQF
jgi:hypothetical protein